MRMTLRLDDDVAALLARVRKSSKAGLKQIVNEALRSGLRAMLAHPRSRTIYRTPSVDLGRCYVSNLDDTTGVIAFLEGDQRK